MFLEIINPNQGAEILGQWTPRARFGLHLQLANLADDIDRALRAGDTAQATRQMNAYFDLVGLSVEGRPGVEQLKAYFDLIRLNQLRHLMPFQKWDGAEPGRRPPPYDYEGRTWTWWVHKLASRYGWTRDEIFNLWPEEAAAYIQEILVSEFDEIDGRRSLSELGYDYDKQTGKGTFRPTPRPGWMVDQPEQRLIRIRRSALPVGHVVKLDGSPLEH